VKPGARYPRNRDHITKRDNWTAALAKANTAPLKTLTPMMIESIAASHARRGTPDHAKLVVAINAVIDGRAT